MTEDEKIERPVRLPYDGLFGDSNLIKVIQQVIADPFTEYRPIDLEKLTKESSPTVRASLKTLTSLGLLIKDESDRQHPVYRVNTESKRYLALTFLAYAVLDDRNSTDSMDQILADYCDSVLSEKYRAYETTPAYTPDQAQAEMSPIGLYAAGSELLIKVSGVVTPQRVECSPTISDDTWLHLSYGSHQARDLSGKPLGTSKGEGYGAVAA